MSIEVTGGNDNAASTDFLVQQQAQQRDARFQQMPQMDGGSQSPGSSGPSQFTSTPGGPPTGRHISSAQRPGSSQALLAQKQAEMRQLMAKAPTVVQQLRQRMDDKNTDRYYRSTEVSVIGAQSPDGSTMTPGQTRPAPNSFRSGRLRQLDERNTDRYYRDSLERGMTKQQIEQNSRLATAQQGQGQQQPPQLPAQGSQNVPVHHAQAVHPLVIAKREELWPVMEQAAQVIRAGAAPRVVVRITGPQRLFMLAQTLLDGMVARMVLTREQADSIKIDTSQVGTADVIRGGYAGQTAEQTAVAAFGKPEEALAAASPAADDKPPLDPNAFLNADFSDEDGTPPQAAPVQSDPNTDGREDDDTLAAPLAPSALKSEQPAPAPQAQARPVQRPQSSRKDRRHK